MEKYQPCRVDDSPPDTIGIEGRLVKRKSLSPKQNRELDKHLSKLQKNEERALKLANKQLNPSKLSVWLKRIAIGLLIMPGSSGVLLGCCATAVKPEASVTAPKVEAVPEVNREWLEDEKKATEELTAYFINNIDKHLPAGFKPLEMGGTVAQSAFNYKGIDFRVSFWIKLEDTDGKFSGTGLYMVFSDATFEGKKKIFSKDSGIEL